MKRYNVFNNIHKALRHMLFDIHLKMQQTDFDDPAMQSLLDELDRILDCYDEHGEHEDRFLLAPVKELDPSLARQLEEDHVKDHVFSKALRDRIASFAGIDDAGQRQSAGREIFYALNDFVAFNLYHMNREETEFLPVLWKHFTDAEILVMQQQIVAAVDPLFLQIQSRWIMRSITNTELSQWLSGIRAGAPAPVYQQFLKMAEEETGPVRFAALDLHPA